MRARARTTDDNKVKRHFVVICMYVFCHHIPNQEIYMPTADCHPGNPCGELFIRWRWGGTFIVICVPPLAPPRPLVRTSETPRCSCWLRTRCHSTPGPRERIKGSDHGTNFEYFCYYIALVSLVAPVLTQNLELQYLVLSARDCCQFPVDTSLPPLCPLNVRRLLQESLHLSQTVSWSGDWLQKHR